jgi:hypothetical protein
MKIAENRIENFEVPQSFSRHKEQAEVYLPARKETKFSNDGEKKLMESFRRGVAVASLRN